MTNRVLLINDTEDVYHWGCYGTSHALKTQLTNQQLKIVDTIPVYDVHNLAWYPNHVSEFGGKENFISRFPELSEKMQNCDRIVVNGEGTIHHFSGYPKALLYLIYAGKEYFGKNISLINHSCFPSTDDKDTLDFYRKAYQCCDYIAAREKRSVNTIKEKLGMPCELAFDSLPLAAKEIEKSVGRVINENYICISGAVNYKHHRSEMIAKLILKLYPNHRYIYLAGSKKEGIHHEEPIVYESLKKYMPTIEMYGATSFEEWISIIKYSKILISGRYHYTIGAMCTGTPTVFFPSNTPKIDAIAEEYKLPRPVSSENDRKFKIKLYLALKWAGIRRWKNLTAILAISASNNYKW